MSATRPIARLIAFYLPQFHPIPENDEWWGKGFTEWTNTAKARPLFRGHYQPHLPADLGFYDLRVPETRVTQARMARQYGIEAFCYYHYWFAGKRLLERPFDEVLASGEPDFPFCLCWANQTWSGIWHGAPNRILIEQTYPGMDDHRRHFDMLLPAFCDRRAVRVDGKPVFIVYAPKDLPDSSRVVQLWRDLAVKAGLPGLFLIACDNQPGWDPKASGYDASMVIRASYKRRPWVPWSEPTTKIRGKVAQLLGRPAVYRYERVIRDLLPERVPGLEQYPGVVPNWDNTPRSGANGMVFHESTPELFRKHLCAALNLVADLPTDHRLVFVKSWNEWAEGNHLEPDLRYGRRFLEVVRDEVLVEHACSKVP